LDSPDVERVKVGSGGVLIGQVGQSEDLAMDEGAPAAAATALAGRTIGIQVPPIVQGDVRSDFIQGARAAIEGFGANAQQCPGVLFDGNRAFCDGKAIDGLVVFQAEPGNWEIRPRTIKSGFAVAVTDVGQRLTKGMVRLRNDPTGLGLEQGRAAGAWAAAAWPDAEVSVGIHYPFSPDSDHPYRQAVAAGVIESIPAATILPPEEVGDADLHIGYIPSALTEGLLADFNATGEPVGLFPTTCPDPLPTDVWFAGCTRLDFGDVGAAGANAVAKVLTGGEVPAEILSSPGVEIVTSK
jgi:hypothetical protein